MEERGEVDAFVDADGWHWFDPRLVEQVRLDKQPLAARAWELFDAGNTVAQVVSALQAQPAAIIEWHRSWCEAHNVIILQLPMIANRPEELAHALEVWCKTYNLRPEDLRNPRLLLRALEICSSMPSLRALLDAPPPTVG